jgi:hypothetical protein
MGQTILLLSDINFLRLSPDMVLTPVEMMYGG